MQHLPTPTTRQLPFLWIFMISLTLLLTGCFSGSNSGGDNPPPPSAYSLAIEKITAYAQSNGTSATPTLQDYADAGVTGVTAANLSDMNQVVENLTPAEVDTTAELQALADALGVVADTTPPLFTSPSTASVPENQTGAITLAATDASTVTYSISDGNASSFTVDTTSGVVTFLTAPDYESGNILYTFTATATDTSGNSADQNVTIHVTDVNESGTDADGDGYTTPADCNDNNASIHPDALEIFADTIDNNCNGQTDENSFLTELDGNWTDSFANHYTFDIPLQTWSVIFGNNSTETIMLSAVNSAQRYFIIKHGATANQSLANKYSKVYATPVINSNTGAYFYICEVTYGHATITSADDPNSVADSSNPETGGCGGFAWTKATKVP